jgi:hypothetical protein
MVPLEMNEGTNYFQGGTKGLSLRPRCIGAAWSLPSGHHHHHQQHAVKEKVKEELQMEFKMAFQFTETNIWTEWE